MRRIASQDDATRMPPPEAGRPLNSDQIERLRRWIDAGAKWEAHWAFRPIVRPKPPPANSAWARREIDAFVLAKLNELGLSPSEEADRFMLLRRLSFDLRGLPPTLEEAEAFIADDSVDAYEREVDRLLASPQYGERWGRHWLDLARYADSTGFETDAPRMIWKYRDWVINAINADLGFDEFTLRQIAGDLLPNAAIDDRVATGFLLNSQQDGGSEPSRLDAVVDRTNTLGSVFLGLTVGCAQCHSHKFDPISQREYYSLFAFVNSADELLLEFATAEEIARRDALRAQIATLDAELSKYVALLGDMRPADDAGFQQRTRTIEQLKASVPQFVGTPVMTAANRRTTVFLRGDYAQPGEEATAGVPRVLPALPPGKPTRVDFARWLTSREQPLTPRVTVNRVWQRLFGRGLVETENDFGVQGARPSHPELLDWLSSEFVEHRWQLKRLLRTIATSSTYRQDSRRRADLDAVDPENRWMARQSRIRLEAEAIRDSALHAGGLLSRKLGGPSVFPHQHDGVLLNRATPATWTVSAGEDRYRRGLYTYFWRLTPHPFLQAFDAPDAIASCTRRTPTNTPLQALTLLNDPAFVEAAEALALRLLSEPPDSEATRIERLWKRCLAREPSPEERTLVLNLLDESRQRFKGDERSAWTQVTRTVLNLDEFITRE